MMRFGLFLAVPSLALALAACSISVELPDERSLPLGPNQYCDCVMNGRCAVLEERPGYSEVRNLDCNWIRRGEIAHCTFESRFVETVGDDPTLRPIVDDWAPGAIRARRVRDASWCRL